MTHAPTHIPTLGGDPGAPPTPHHPLRGYPARDAERRMGCAGSVTELDQFSPRRTVRR